MTQLKKLSLSMTVMTVLGLGIVGCGGSSSSVDTDTPNQNSSRSSENNISNNNASNQNSNSSSENNISNNNASSQNSNITVDKIINSKYTIVEGDKLLGFRNSHMTFNVLDGEIEVQKDNKSATISYEVINNNIMKLLWDEDDIMYDKIINISSNVISFCSKRALTDVKTCNEVNKYWVKSDIENVLKRVNSNPDMLPRTLVTNFDEIKNKNLYQLASQGTEEIIINSDNSITGSIGSDSYYTASFNNNTLQIVGYDDYDEDDYDRSNQVYKYDLTNQTISLKKFSEEEFFDDKELTSGYPDKTFKFTSGTMYCHILWSECWVDETTINQMKNQL